jgi:hypothetical protein
MLLPQVTRRSPGLARVIGTATNSRLGAPIGGSRTVAAASDVTQL